MRILFTLSAAAALAAGASAQQLDHNGNFVGGGPGASAPGAVLDTWTGPSSRGTGLAHNGDLLYMLDSYGGLPVVHHLRDSDGAVLGSTPIANTTDYECAWDDKRELIVTTNASLDVLYGYTRTGVQMFAWPFPSTGYVGVAWDCRRDVYWVSDWTVSSVIAINAATGVPTGASYNTGAYGLSRISGTAYDSNTDTIYVCGRDQNMIAGFNAATGAMVCTFPVAEPNSNAVAGMTVAPRGSIYTAQYFNSNHYELEGCHGLRPQLRMTPNFPTAGSPITMTMAGLNAGERGLFAYSLTGCGPTPSPIGDVLLSNPRAVLASVPANGAGVSSISAVLPTVLAGRTVYLHGGGLSGSGRCNAAIMKP